MYIKLIPYMVSNFLLEHHIRNVEPITKFKIKGIMYGLVKRIKQVEVIRPYNNELEVADKALHRGGKLFYNNIHPINRLKVFNLIKTITICTKRERTVQLVEELLDDEIESYEFLSGLMLLLKDERIKTLFSSITTLDGKEDKLSELIAHAYTYMENVDICDSIPLFSKVLIDIYKSNKLK